MIWDLRPHATRVFEIKDSTRRVHLWLKSQIWESSRGMFSRWPAFSASYSATRRQGLSPRMRIRKVSCTIDRRQVGAKHRKSKEKKRKEMILKNTRYDPGVRNTLVTSSALLHLKQGPPCLLRLEPLSEVKSAKTRHSRWVYAQNLRFQLWPPRPPGS